MDVVTYPAAVIDFSSDNLIPWRGQADAKSISDDFNVKWTPTLITLGLRAKHTLGPAVFSRRKSCLPGSDKLFNRAGHIFAAAHRGFDLAMTIWAF